ncbi:uncharacterized protein LOC134190659 [Corticium candelabrum]|uniref:uncharacterized protein LOC134190659 n=1 Tax=Corticium candelabrum TaxID=121492 RepID=UPI002E255525|nr:uncharacterized protein LOC134190659 [Corticium candelabrum]
MTLVVPSKLPAYLRASDGSPGADLRSVLKFDQARVDNLYTLDADKHEMRFEFLEMGVKYGETEKSSTPVRVALTLSADSKRNVTLTFVEKVVEKWGINFVGTVTVSHGNGQTFAVYLPGIRTYDAAGISGDPHASERIGAGCANTQLSITIAQLVALRDGATLEQLGEIQDAMKNVVACYHGRMALSQWMKAQLVHAIIEKKEVTPYPEFIQQMIDDGKLEINANRAHTKIYLESYKAGRPVSPPQFYKKCAAKEDPSTFLNADQLKEFRQLAEE